jgi:hypothetical protein
MRCSQTEVIVMNSTSPRHASNRRRLFVYLVLVLALAVAVAVFDMAYGEQRLAPWIGGRPNNVIPPGEPFAKYAYYEEGGVRLGQWQIVRPPVYLEFLGYVVVMPEGGRPVAVTENRVFYRSGSLQRDVKAYDSTGTEIDFYPLTLTQEEASRLAPHARVVAFEYDESGTLAARHEWVNGILRP